MWIMVVYVLIVVVNEIVVVTIGLVLDRTYPFASLPISLTPFFAVPWLSWVLLVRWTEPKREYHLVQSLSSQEKVRRE